MYGPFPAITGLGKECETQPLWTAVATQQPADGGDRETGGIGVGLMVC